MYNSQTPPPYVPAGQAISLDAKVTQVMKRVYVRMFIGLLVTAFCAWGTYAYATEFMVTMVQNRLIYWGMFIAEIAIVMWMTARIDKMSVTTATLLFLLFSAINGVTLSLIFACYSLGSIGKTFLICSATFGAMSVYGYLTDRDLSRIGSLLTMALFGLIICCVVNIFWANSTFDWIISGVGVLIFIGLTAWDTQKLKQLSAVAAPETYGRIATLGALTLYLDFINLFLFLLRFFGSSDD